MSLEREAEVFKRELPLLLADPVNVGRFVLIGGTPPEVAGVYPTRDDALTVGYERFGLFTAFLVQQIEPAGPPKYFSRNLRCPT